VGDPIIRLSPELIISRVRRSTFCRALNHWRSAATRHNGVAEVRRREGSPEVTDPARPDHDRDDEPDPRFLLANERTFLAWIRTSLALIAAGAGTLTFLDDIGSDAARRALGIMLLGTGAVVALFSPRRWASTNRALRSGDRLPDALLLPVVAIVVGISAIVLLVGAVLG
jgi:putative membrane protein